MRLIRPCESTWGLPFHQIRQGSAGQHKMRTRKGSKTMRHWVRPKRIPCLPVYASKNVFIHAFHSQNSTPLCRYTYEHVYVHTHIHISFSLALDLTKSASVYLWGRDDCRQTRSNIAAAFDELNAAAEALGRRSTEQFGVCVHVCTTESTYIDTRHKIVVHLYIYIYIYMYIYIYIYICVYADTHTYRRLPIDVYAYTSGARFRSGFGARGSEAVRERGSGAVPERGWERFRGVVRKRATARLWRERGS